MDYIWSPWRMEYIQNSTREDTCVFCSELIKTDRMASLVVFKGENAFVILNRFPYTSGHLMVVPVVHQARLDRLDLDTRTEIMEFTSDAVKVLEIEYKPDGFNIGMNLGEPAGAGIVDHLHMHVVPRWTGDTNFMSTMAKTRVLPEALEETYKRLTKAWNIYLQNTRK